VLVRGAYSFARSARMIGAVHAAAKARGRTHILLDLRGIPEPVPDAERFALGELVGTGWRDLVVAFIDLTETPDQFVETMAANRGAVIRGFLDEPAALAWLGAPPRQQR